jgi:hypothetical protein
VYYAAADKITVYGKSSAEGCQRLLEMGLQGAAEKVLATAWRNLLQREWWVVMTQNSHRN